VHYIINTVEKSTKDRDRKIWLASPLVRKLTWIEIHRVNEYVQFIEDNTKITASKKLPPKGFSGISHSVAPV